MAEAIKGEITNGTQPSEALRWALAHVAAPVELAPEQIALVGGVNHLTIPTEVTHHTPNFLD